MNKRDIKNLIVINSLFVIFVIFILLRGDTYISTVDFISQHFRIPEYIRTLFYSTGNLFPNFAFHLGAGQNIYYLVYHGLFNPIIIISYFFPFIKMADYIIISNIILIIISVCLLYKWLKGKYKDKVAFVSSLLFLLAGPIIFHTHRHIMFVNYMPFLISALVGVDKYFENHNKKQLIISTFLIIITSYFYSVGAIVAICIYGLYKYLTITKKIEFKLIFKEAFKFILTLIVPIVMASFVLIPTIFALISGRSDTLNSINFISLFIPNIDINLFMYHAYSVGVGAIFIIAMIILFLSKKKENKVITSICLIMLVFPIFNYLLNGFMYIDGKSFIPLLPIFIYIIASAFDIILKRKIDLKRFTLVSIIVFLIIIVFNINFDYLILFVCDYLMVIGVIWMYFKIKNYYLLIIPIILLNIGSTLAINLNEHYVSRALYNNINNLNNVTINDNSIYRTGNLNYILENVNNVINDHYYTDTIYSSLSNSMYTNFVRNTFKNDVYNKDYHTLTQSNSILFNMFMGNKYLISSYGIIGYDKIDDNIYVNDDVFDIIYASDLLMSNREFSLLEYPYTIDALMRYTIVDADIDNVYENKVNIYDGSIIVDDYSNIDYSYQDGTYYIDTNSNNYLNIKLDDYVKDKILVISFDMDYNDTKDSTVTINNTVNTLSYKGWKYHNNNYTFHYVISSDTDNSNLNISFSKGHFEISNINIYVLDYDNYKNITNNHTAFNFNTDSSIGDVIKGTINTTSDTYLVTSIPYDEGFRVYVDGEEIDYEIVNTAFLGFKLDSGYHNIEIKYVANGANIGKIISCFGVIIYLIIVWRSKYEKN